jgi:5-methylcytosine-specific restriction endonuclease McrA
MPYANKKEDKIKSDRARYRRNREKILQQKRSYYERNREIILAKITAKRRANPEAHRAASAAWKQRNQEKAKAIFDRWYAANRDRLLEEMRQRSRAWYKENRERHLESSRLWASANRDKKNAHSKNRRARELDADGYYTAEDVEALWVAQDGKCANPHCATPLAVSCTVDHKVPLTRGGSHWPSNLQLMCHPCNASKGSKTMEEWLD